MPTDTQITNFDRPTAVALSSEIERALKQIAEAHGLELVYRGGSYDGGTYKPRVEFKTQASGANEFAAFADMYGLQASDFGREFSSQGRTFRISGVSPRSPRRPLLAVEVATGRTFKFTEAGVRAALVQSIGTATTPPQAPSAPKQYALVVDGEPVKTSSSKASLQSYKSRNGLSNAVILEVN